MRAVRQRGTMVGIELNEIAGRQVGAEVCMAARRHGVLLRPLGPVIVWMPPLSITAAQLDQLGWATRESIRDVLHV